MSRTTRTSARDRAFRVRRPDTRTDVGAAVIAAVIGLGVVPLLGPSFAGALLVFVVAGLGATACGFLPVRAAAPVIVVLLLAGVVALIAANADLTLLVSGACGLAAGAGPMSRIFWIRQQAA